ncbi:MAG: DUF4097 domain-containing protein [Coriobacteriia bacterium]|nr:DUF4097 domain-containing protein [Coriobacteriia bacterium]
MTMKPATKTLWLLILAAFSIGMGFMGLGIALGGFLPAGFGSNGMRFYDFRQGITYDSRMQQHRSPQLTGENFDDSLLSESAVISEPIDQLSVQTIAAVVVIVPSTDAQLSYAITAADPTRYKVEVKDGTLDISYQHTIYPFDIGTLDVIGDAGDSNDQVVVYLPQGMRLQEVQLSTVTGRIEIHEGLLVQELAVATVSGSIFIEELDQQNLRDTELSIESVNGSVSVVADTLAHLKLNLVSADAHIVLYNLDEFRVRVDNISGTVIKDGRGITAGIGTTASGTGSRLIEIEMINGMVNLESAIDDGEQ